MGTSLYNRFPGYFGEAVHCCRTQLRISQEELAARSQLHRTYIAGVERGTRNPSLKSIAKIANGLGMPVSALFQYMESMPHRGRGGSGSETKA